MATGKQEAQRQRDNMSARRTDQGSKEVFSEEEEKRSTEENYEEMMWEVTSSTTARRKLPGTRQHDKEVISKIPETVDDFLRNFLRRHGLSRTLNSFETEWYSSVHKHLTGSVAAASPCVFFIPDALTHRQLIQNELETVSMEADQLKKEVLVAGENLVRLQRERDFHRLQYRRVAEDKNRLIEDLKKLKVHLESFKPALKQLEDKYQAALRQKMHISLEKERLQNATEVRLKEQRTRISKSSAKSTKTRQQRPIEFPVYSSLVNPSGDQVDYKHLREVTSLSLSSSIRAHKLPISCIELHPRSQIAVSTSDDCTWRLWALPAAGEKVGQLVLTGEGHSDWLSDCSFHPDGSKLATTSGDSTVRLWDFYCGCCILTLTGHGQPTWGCSFHSSGHFLASSSADRTTRLWDLNSECCHLTLRCHTASVNSVCFLPLSNHLLTCSADKTVVMWDARLGVCTASFHGHQHPCNHAAFNLAGTIAASCDTHGVVNLWDPRKPGLALAMLDVGPLAANQVAFSPTGKMLAVASSDSLVRLVEVDTCVVSSLPGHSDAVQSVKFDHMGETLVSAGSDGVINIWTEKLQ
ncbi:uncharacterized protein V6R79_011712 [Siganus canaliculatus]